MTDTNPYAPPHETDTSVNPRVAVRAPAISLIVASLIGLMSVLITLSFNIVIGVGYLTGQIQPPAGYLSQVAFRAAWSLLILVSNVIILIGSINMLGLKRYDVCRLAATLAIVPCIGPCYLLGIPFGVWATIVLNKPEVREAFDKS